MRFSVSVIAAAALFNSFFAHAQTGIKSLTPPTEEQIEQAHQKNVRDGLFDAADKVQLEWQQNIDHVKPSPSSALRVNVPDPKRSKPDSSQNKKGNSDAGLDAFIKRFENSVNNGTKELSKNTGKSNIAVFVSLSMPPETLRELARQAKEANAVVVLRGMKNNSVEQTRDYVAEIDPVRAQWIINPEMFKAYSVDKVPAIAVGTSESSNVGDDGCAPPGSFNVVFGDISIQQGLRIISDKGADDVSKLALEELHRLQLFGMRTK